MILHAGLVALRLGERWQGALILGPSGSGKSDLALRALDVAFRLVADDRTVVWTSGGALFGRAPPAIAGLIEARGHGVLPAPQIGLAQIVLAVRCSAEPVERMPAPQSEIVCGLAIPRLDLDPREASAPAKLSRALQHLGHAPQQAYQADPLGGGDHAGTGDTH